MIRFTTKYKTFVSQSIHLQCPDYRRLLNKNKIVTDNSIRIQFDYPLTNKLIKSYKTTKSGFTKSELIRRISTEYKSIYREEVTTSTIIPRLMDRSFNRNRTNGKYGIWGHTLSDLQLCSLRRVNGLYVLQIDS